MNTCRKTLCKTAMFLLLLMLACNIAKESQAYIAYEYTGAAFTYSSFPGHPDTTDYISGYIRVDPSALPPSTSTYVGHGYVDFSFSAGPYTFVSSNPLLSQGWSLGFTTDSNRDIIDWQISLVINDTTPWGTYTNTGLVIGWGGAESYGDYFVYAELEAPWGPSPIIARYSAYNETNGNWQKINSPFVPIPPPAYSILLLGLLGWWGSGECSRSNETHKLEEQGMKKIFLLVSMVGLLIFAPFGSAKADFYITSKAEMDWSKLSITGPIEWTSQRTQITSSAQDRVIVNGQVVQVGDGDFIQTPGWINTTVTHSVYQAQSYIEATDNLLKAEAQTGKADANYLQYFTWSSVGRAGVFNYTGLTPGYVTISIPYRLSFNIIPQAGYTPMSANTYATIGMQNQQQTESKSQSVSLGPLGAPTTNGFIEGTLSIQRMFYPGDSTWNFGASISAHSELWDCINYPTACGGGSGGSPVPIPGAVWLLGSGLLGLIGIRRRFKK